MSRFPCFTFSFGSFNNYVDQILPNFDHLPPLVENCGHFTYTVQGQAFLSYGLGCGLWLKAKACQGQTFIYGPTLDEGIYVPSGWKHYARGRKTVRQTFVSGCFFQSKGEKTVFARETNVLPEFFCPRHNVFQTGGYIFLGFHPLTYLPTISHYILMGSVSYCSCRFCIISWPIGRPPTKQLGGPGGQRPPWLRSEDF